MIKLRKTIIISLKLMSEHLKTTTWNSLKG
jgi:hypothetical protein